MIFENLVFSLRGAIVRKVTCIFVANFLHQKVLTKINRHANSSHECSFLHKQSQFALLLDMLENPLHVRRDLDKRAIREER